MVFVVSGKLGSGKSYHCCDMAIEHLLAGGVVATNMVLHFDRICKNFHRALRPWQLVKIDATSDPHTIPSGDLRGHGKRRVMVILDEALNWFASSAGSKDERKNAWSEWLRQSDKIGQDVYFIAQEFGRAAKWIRELAHVAIRITNFKNFSILRQPVGKWLHLHRVYCVCKYEVQSTTLVGFRTYFTSPKIWSCYETSELFGFERPAQGYLGTVPRAFTLPFWPLFVLFLYVVGIWVYA